MVVGYKVLSVLWSIFGPNLRSQTQFLQSEIWSFQFYGQFLSGPDMDHISGTQCTMQTLVKRYNGDQAAGV